MSFLGKDIAAGRRLQPPEIGAHQPSAANSHRGQRTFQITGIAFWRGAAVPWTLGLVDLTIRPLTAGLWPALEDLFGRAGASNGCWCMYWRIGPRYKDRPREDNKRDLERLATSGPPPGLLAFDGEVPAGWCELAPRTSLAWLAHARYLRPVDDLPVWSVPCFYVRRTHRGQGVPDALIEAALSAAAASGAPALEAYPVDTAVPGHSRNLFPGVASAFARHGFQVVARHKPDRPIMRKRLSRTAAMGHEAAGPGRSPASKPPDQSG